ncbi:hypothetical protein RSAG8_11966, partial [Rhizoctonia solani AG-8 WAC10335]
MSRRARPIEETGSHKTNTIHVEQMGTRRRARHVPLAKDISEPEPPVQLSADANSRRAVEELVELEFAQDDHLPTAATSDTRPLHDHDPLGPELEEQFEDLDDFLKQSGQGQNGMLRKWLRDYSQAYLRELYKHYKPPHNSHCSCRTPAGERYRCDDCITDLRYCSTCVLTNHKHSPTHRISRWNGTTWLKTTLKDAGLILRLGDHPNCTTHHEQDISVGDITGFHQVRVTYCGCDAMDEPAMLLCTGLMPCSNFQPCSAFTLHSLCIFDFFAVDAKVSASRFHASACLRELLHVTRQYLILQLLKQAGQTTTTPKDLGCLALRCPACPRLGVNYILSDVMAGLEWLFTQLISYDGSFQLIRKNKAHDKQDISLTDMFMYWGSQLHYAAHLLANKDTAYDTALKNDHCNNHRAAGDTWVRQSGVAETGLGAVTCARHTMFMPQGTVNYWKVVQLLMNEGADRIGVFYDIYCHWVTHFWERAPKILLPAGQLQRPAHFFGAVPKYHLATHINSCYTWYLLNNMEGVGHLDAEGCEHACANLNQASGSTLEKGPGARIDSLNHCMNDWNWWKLVSMGAHLPPADLDLHVEAWIQNGGRDGGAMADCASLGCLLCNSKVGSNVHGTKAGQRCMDQCLSDESNRRGFSPFTCPKGSHYQSIGGTRLKKVLELNLLESACNIDNDSSELAFTAPTWLSDGLDIEKLQKRPRDDINSYGKRMSDKQIVDISTRKTAISSRITTHRSHASHFIDIRPAKTSNLGSLSEETDSRPEIADLHLPSHIYKSVTRTEQSLRIVKMEEELRRAECYETLRRVRTTTSQKVQITQGKHQNARGEVANTHAQTMITRLAVCVKQAKDDYNQSYQALINLG